MASVHESKMNRRKMQELADQAYLREMSVALSELEAEFGRWRSGEIDPFELNQRIHGFHQGVSRDLFATYNSGNLELQIARAVARGVVAPEEVPESVLNASEKLIRFLSEKTATATPKAPPKRRAAPRGSKRA